MGVKGDWTRPRQITKEEWDRNFERAFATVTPIAELEFFGLPVRIINMIEQGMKTVWLEDLPDREKTLKYELQKIAQLGPYWADRVWKTIERKRRKGLSRLTLPSS